jgi:hypothetical protein
MIAGEVKENGTWITQTAPLQLIHRKRAFSLEMRIASRLSLSVRTHSLKSA